MSDEPRTFIKSSHGGLHNPGCRAIARLKNPTEVSHAGADAFDRLPGREGRYSLEFWVTEHRVPWAGTEVSTGIAVGERIGEGAE